MSENTSARPELDSVFDNAGKYNTSVKLTDEDAKANVKIYCKEPYAQELYDKMKAYEERTGIPTHQCKDLEEGSICEVRATKISFDDKIIIAEEVNSKVEVMIPFKEFSGSIEELTKGENLIFHTMIKSASESGEYSASERKCRAINYKKELFEMQDGNTWFEVKIIKLIKGGYVALYKNTVECFIPGSHAGANVIRDFSKLLGRTMNVMVDNYDSANDLFILSYKKYIQQSMPTRISELKFGHLYKGTLTTKPYDFGIFVEFEDYFTGLIHATEFENYDEIKSRYKAGDEIEFYVKNVTKKAKQFRIVLTLNKDDIDSEKLQWDELRTQTENKIFDYEVDSKNNSITIHIADDLEYEVTLRRKDLQRDLDRYPQVRVFKVDPINKRLRFEFVEMEG